MYHQKHECCTWWHKCNIHTSNSQHSLPVILTSDKSFRGSHGSASDLQGAAGYQVADVFRSKQIRITASCGARAIITIPIPAARFDATFVFCPTVRALVPCCCVTTSSVISFKNAGMSCDSHSGMSFFVGCLCDLVTARAPVMCAWPAHSIAPMADACDEGSVCGRVVRTLVMWCWA